MEQQHTNSIEKRASTYRSDDVDIMDLMLFLVKKWKLIVIITFLGSSFGVAVALKMPKHYQPSAVVMLPSNNMVEQANNSGLIKYTTKTLFKQYYDYARSDSLLREFIVDNGYISQLSSALNESSSNKAVTELLSSFNVRILEPSPETPRSTFVEFPTRIALELRHSNEPVLVDLLTSYLEYVNDRGVNELANQAKSIRESRLDSLQTKIELLREKALFDRQMRIQRIEEQNSLQINKLENERKLLLELITKNRQTQLAKISEAMSIAKKLGIENPTPIDEFSANNSESATNIKLNAQQELPLFLMGTRYLSALTETLKSRNDERLSTKINELEKQITEIKLDPELASLKKRETDDPYIDGLTALVNEQNELLKKSLSFNEVKMYSLQNQPRITGKNVGPKKFLIVVSAFLISGFLGLIIALIKSGLERRTVKVNLGSSEKQI